MPPIVLLMGPTASGKTALALQLAREFDGEIISVDSAQVYRDMDIGTAKPSAEERAAAPHHLLDVIDPDEAYSAARFRADALRLAGEISARGRLPILAGGTMLYFKALRDGLADLPDADAAVRADIDTEAARKGWPALHAELAKVDAETAARLQPGDAQRIQRALELHRLTGQPPSLLYRQQQRSALPFRPIALALVPSERGVLHERIAARFDAMLRAGLVEELRALKKKYLLSPTLPSMRAVGYRQAWEHLEGDYDAAELRNRGIYATRQLAKRQLTWLRTTPAQAFDCLDPQVDSHVQTFLKAQLTSSLSRRERVSPGLRAACGSPGEQPSDASDGAPCKE